MDSVPRPQPLSTGWPDDPLLEHLLPLIQRAERISVVAAFVRDSGLGLLEQPLLSALRRCAQVRLLTSDYLHATQARGLQRLLSWTADVDSGLLRERDDDDPDEPPPREGGRLEVRVIEMVRLGAASFHPKAWCFAGPDLAAAFVGSSNISHAALRDGVEWNLRIDRRVLAALDAGFILGITATPDRADAADLVGLFEQHLAYRADLAMGIARGLLCPFSYHGIRDDVDYRQVPWRDGRFSTQELTDALATSPRMNRLWQVWQDPARPGRRTQGSGRGRRALPGCRRAVAGRHREGRRGRDPRAARLA